MKRGRPKGRSRDTRSFGPLGDLIRTHRLAKGLGLSEVAEACSCSVQFVSNIEHGRAPLPWEKVELLADVLKVSVEKIQAANLAVRSDFRSFVGATAGRPRKKALSHKHAHPRNTMTASVVALAARDSQLQELIHRYETATLESRKRFIRAAMQMLEV